MKRKRLDISKLNFTKQTMTTEESLKDIEPFRLSNNISNGVYEFKVDKSNLQKFLSKINEQHVSNDFIKSCFEIKNKYSKPTQ